MKLLSDHSEKTKQFLPPNARWQHAELVNLNEADRRLWQSFGRGGQVWVCDVPDLPGFISPEPRMVLISHAPDSQFVAATRFLQAEVESIPNAVFCLALEGEKFRGQRGRAWEALPGNLHLTVVYRADVPVPDVGAGLTMLPAVAAVKTIHALTEGQVPITIKWVNDILICGQKVAGVLTSTQVRNNRILGVVFGVGMNVRQAPRIDPTPFVPAVTAISSHFPGLEQALPRIFGDLIVRIDRLYWELMGEGQVPLFEVYREYADMIGRDVRIWPENTTNWQDVKPFTSGTVIDMRPDLSLILNNSPDPIHMGRLAYTSACRRLGI